MSWGSRNFPYQPVSAEQYLIIGMNTISSHHHNRVNTNIVKGVFATHCINCACPSCVTKLDKY